MATTESDFALGDKASSYWADEYDKLVAALQGLVALFNAKITTGTEPNDHLQGLELGDAAAHNDIRIHYDGTNVNIQQNVGSEGSPAWQNRISIGATTGNMTALGTFSPGGLDMGGNNITNAGTINAVTLTAHASRHQSGGADAFSFATPSDVASANAAGAATSFVRGDHAHRGVRSFNTAFGDVTVSGSTGITVSGTSSTTIASDFREYAYFDNTPGNISLTATGSATIVGGFSNLALPGANSAADYLLTFSGSLTTGTGAENTTFRIHVGTSGDATDAAVATIIVESLATGDTPYFTFRGLAINATTSDRVTVSYQSSSGSRHTLEGSSTMRPVLTIKRLTGITSH